MGPRALRVSITVALFVSGAGQGAVRGGRNPRWQAFLEAAGSDQKRAQAALAEIGARWRDPTGRRSSICSVSCRRHASTKPTTARRQRSSKTQAIPDR